MRLIVTRTESFVIGYKHADSCRSEEMRWCEVNYLLDCCEEYASQLASSKEIRLSFIDLYGKSKWTPKVKTKPTRKDNVITNWKAELSSKIRDAVFEYNNNGNLMPQLMRRPTIRNLGLEAKMKRIFV